MRNTGWIVFLLGCVHAAPPDDLSESSQAVEVGNGVSLNGVSLNGVSLNGVSLNGVSLNGVSLNGVSLNGVSLDGVSLDGTELTGSTGIATLTLDSTGALMTAQLSNGATLQLRIDDASELQPGLPAYLISYFNDAGWSPLCGTDSAGAPISALSVLGTWNTERGTAAGGDYTASTTAATFACRGKTIAKCVELGYRIEDGLTTELTACVRMLRADYCGDGTANTVDGQAVNMYDASGVQVDTMSWLREGEWTPDGARCVRSRQDTRAYRAGFWPSCFTDSFATDRCASGFGYGAVVISEVPVTNDLESGESVEGERD